MKMTKIMLLAVFCLALGSLSIACGASLNPNTEGQLQDALQAKTDAFRACYVTALEKDRETKGVVGLKLDLAAESGDVQSSSVNEEKTTIADGDMKQCVADSASDISLEEPPNVPVEGYYDIDFSFE